jgi:2',3'-cyclic-nucleotide 2'-phosphodiesterase (5'-nucleotidase family)
MTDISRSRILVDCRYDARPDAAAAAFIKPYSRQVDSLMSPVVGSVARYMSDYRPESELSNLLSDILLWSGKRYGETPDFAVYNMGGIRAAFAKGPVTLGHILDVAPFENKICFLTLSGETLKELFRQIAKRGGEGVSHGVELEITKDGKLVKALVNGKEVDEHKNYRVATLDYLAQGNDQLTAFKSHSDIKSPQGQEDNVRELIREYFKEQTTAGNVVDSKVEGRIKIVE